ncbi:MAG: hypothetical protein KME45_13150 [Stenomitos rutilans HA7619-LM2]|nr:hypothetical protein [Stenomitos rutilans HA7619-LM2]
MPSSEQPASTIESNATSLVSPEILLSLATAPVLVALVGSHVVAKAVQELGLFSEEIFRGDRLPVLNFPNENQMNPDDRAAS